MDYTINLEAPDQFPFPFEPYPIQVDFMNNLYAALENGKFGIFESPTGTGKSMSVICGSLRWLHDHEQRQKDELQKMLDLQKTQEDKVKETMTSSAGAFDWIVEFAAKKQVEDETKEYKGILDQKLKREAKLEEMRNKARPGIKLKRKFSLLDEEFRELFKDLPKDENSNRLLDDIEDTDKDLLVEEYVSDEESDGRTEKDSDNEDSEDEEHVTKVYFCSRTHSQLAQFVREVKRSPYADNTRVITLASRQNTCINEAVQKLRSLTLINERCLEMQKNKNEVSMEGEGKKKRRKLAGRCQYYKQEAIYKLRDQLLMEVLDIEDSVIKGRRMKACPYYANRYGVPAAQLVALPYNILLHKSTRDAFGIKLKDNIVIVDEAHNLVETINNAYSVQVSLDQFTRAHSQLSQYMKKFTSRLLAKNLLYIRQILFILDSCIKLLSGKPSDTGPPQSSVKLLKLQDFLNALSIDNINIFKVLKYCQKSHISKKLHGFVDKYRPPLEVKPDENDKKKPAASGLEQYLKGLADKASPTTATTTESIEEVAVNQREDLTRPSSPLMQIESLLEALTCTNDDGRILVNKQATPSQSSVKFVLMNPAVHFRTVVEEARAIIVAGGTMQPVSEFKDQLCYSTGVSPDRIMEFSCGHVIPAHHLLPVALSCGPTGLLLDFTYQNRDQTKLLDELGRVISNVCNVVPGGVVVFLPSYEYESKVVQHWQKNGTQQKICKVKEIFREPKKSNLCDAVLREYTAAVQQPKENRRGALLLCVVGGKMSEGINFSDDLGRCIIMVGLPYPNRFSPELKEKMDYLNVHYPRGEDGRQPGQVHYENLCMKAVNQSIGRAIRHRNDYASILLLDQRYTRQSTLGKLPAWIAQHVRKCEKFGPALAAIAKFFASKKLDKSVV